MGPAQESSWSDRRELVTGGTGFIGGRLAERLVREKGASVQLLVRDPGKASRLLRLGCRSIVGDLGDPDSLAEATSGCDIAFHCAHAFGLGMADALRINVGGTRSLIESCRDAGVSRFIYLSSVSVYGRAPADGTTEAQPLRHTGDPYADAKIEAEKEVFSFGERYGMPVVVLRPAIVYGPGSRIWSLGIIRALRARHPLVIGRGDGICNLLYVDDLVDAMFLSAEVERAAGQAFIIAAGEPCTWRKFIDSYARMIGLDRAPACPRFLALLVAWIFRPVDLLLHRLQDTPSREPARLLVRGSRFFLSRLREAGFRFCAFTPQDIRYFCHRAAFDIRKAREVLGYLPRIDMREGMERTEAWLRQAGYLSGGQG